MLHPWSDSCTETSFRRYFSVFVSRRCPAVTQSQATVAALNPILESYLAVSSVHLSLHQVQDLTSSTCLETHAPRVLGSPPHPNASFEATSFRQRSSPHASEIDHRYRKKLFLPWDLCRHLSRLVRLALIAMVSVLSQLCHLQSQRSSRLSLT